MPRSNRRTSIAGLALAALLALAGCTSNGGTSGQSPAGGGGDGTAPQTSADANSAQGFQAAKMVAPANVWLDERYAEGFHQIDFEGYPLTVSSDRSTLAAKHSETSAEGIDIETGESAWKLDGYNCIAGANGFAFCADETARTIHVLNPKTGQVAQIPDMPGEAISISTIGASDEIGYVHNIRNNTLSGVRLDGSIVWQTPYEVSHATCQLVSDFIGCADSESLAVFDAATGERTFEEATGSVVWAADGYVDVLTGVGYDLTGAEVAETAYPGGVWPGDDEHVYYSVADNAAAFTLTGGLGLAFNEDGRYSVIHPDDRGVPANHLQLLPSGTEIAASTSMVVGASADGSLVALLQDDQFMLINDEGTEIGKGNHPGLTISDGILFSLHGLAESTTLLLPGSAQG